MSAVETRVDDGYYAVRYNGMVGFYRLRTSKGGRWDGHQWVNRFHSDDASKVSRAEGDAVRAAIATDPARAGAAFAQDIGVCYVCGRTLTDPASRAYGIGPVCRGASWTAEDRLRIDTPERIEPPEAVRAEEEAASGNHQRRTAPGAPVEDAAPPTSAPIVAGVLTVNGAKATLVSNYDPEAVAFARAVPGRRWDGAAKTNTFPVNAATAPMLAEMCERFRYAIEGDGLPDVAAIRERQERNVQASRATDASIEVDGLGGELLPFQKAGVAYALANGSVLIGDEMGLGKTVEALAALQAADAFPALVIVPATVKLNWERETRKWLPGRSITVLSGRNGNRGPLGEADVTILNYDIVTARLPELQAVAWRALVADESHYAKNSKAKRTKAVRALARKIDLRILLTGTPVLNRPVELISQLDILGHLDDFGGFWSFAKRYCGAYNSGYGWDFSGASNLDELHAKLRRTCYVRRTKEQVLPELPAKRRATVPMELTDRAAYDAVEADLRRWFEDQVERDSEFQALLDDLDPEDADRAERVEVERRDRRARQAEVLVKINALKQTAARQKLDAVRGWIEDFLESDRKLVVFAHHQEIVGALAASLGADSITGDTPIAARQARVDRFQSDPASRVLVCNIAAGGVGITLTAASDVAFVELPWRPGDLDQAEDRCHRIGQSDSVTAWYLLGAGTIDEEIAEMLDEKRGVVEAATDGKEAASHSILAALTAAILARGEAA